MRLSTLAVPSAWLVVVLTSRLTAQTTSPKATPAAPVAALAYRLDGKLLAASGYGEVLLLDPANGDLLDKLSGQKPKVTALAFSRDGQRLAVASGEASQAAEVRIYVVPLDGLPDPKSEQVLSGHKDLVYDLAFSPDGKVLATCGYDRLIKLWDVATGKELNTLKDHSDTIYGVAFSPDGQWLASGAADRAVKIWEVATGKRLHTLGEATDWIYAVAWSPDGQRVAAAGVDKSIRVWQVTADGVKLVQSAFAHEKPVVRLVYSADGQTLYSLGEDRVLKAWNTAQMVERHVYPKQTEAVLALALRPDQKQLAVGRYDGSAVLLDEETGQVQSQPLPARPKPPRVTKVTPTAGQRGQVLQLTLEGKYLEGATQLTVAHPGASGKILTEKRTDNLLPIEVTFPADTPAGVYSLGLKSDAGDSAAIPFTVDLFAQTAEAEPNDLPSMGQKITLPATLVGAIDKAGDMDYYRFEATAGQEIGVQVLAAALGSKLEPELVLTDASGQVLRQGNRGFLGYTCTQAGTYSLGIRDREYRGGGMPYRLYIGPIPVVTSLYPLGLQRGTEAEIHLDGVYLGAPTSVKVRAPTEAAIGSRLPVPITTPLGKPLGNLEVVVGEFQEALHPSPASHALPTLTNPGTANGQIGQPGATETWRFTAKKGQPLVLEVHARRLGSPLDSYLEILDLHDQPVPRATLRCISKTYTTFRDHDSAGSGIRIEAWNDLAINDLLLVGSELVKIRELPKNPDDDCQFFNIDGVRTGYLGTTPTYHSLGTPMYKVTIHPPGTAFPPNGLPVVTLYYRNDDGGPGFGKDSYLTFDSPADGDYQVRVGDSRGQGGKEYSYRLTVRPPRPSFNVSFNPTVPSVWKGNAIPVSVTADRIDGFEGAIDLALENVPPGFSAPSTSIPAGERNTTFALYAESTAATPDGLPPLKLVARATINGEQVVSEVNGGLPKVVDPGDLVTTTEQSEVTVKPGQQVRLTAKIERRNGFAGRVPVEVRGLPHGVRVLDIGLNGILITEKESSRTFVIYCEPWVQPTEHPFVVLAKEEGKGTEFAAKSVLLKIAGR
jgi:hypothetical protein